MVCAITTAVSEARDGGGQLVGQGVGEVILRRIAGEIGEGQHHDGKTRRLGRRLRGDGRGSIGGEEIPSAAGDNEDQSCDPGGEKREPRTLFRLGRFLRRGLRPRRLADFERIDPNRVGNILELPRTEIADGKIKPPFDLTIGVLGQADRAWLADAFEPRRDVDAVAHEIAITLLDDIAEMNADPELDATLRRQPGIALGHAALHLDCAAHGVDDAAEFNNRAVASPLNGAAVVSGDGRINEIAAEPP